RPATGWRSWGRIGTRRSRGSWDAGGGDRRRYVVRGERRTANGDRGRGIPAAGSATSFRPPCASHSRTDIYRTHLYQGARMSIFSKIRDKIFGKKAVPPPPPPPPVGRGQAGTPMAPPPPPVLDEVD